MVESRVKIEKLLQFVQLLPILRKLLNCLFAEGVTDHVQQYLGCNGQVVRSGEQSIGGLGGSMILLLAATTKKYSSFFDLFFMLN
jgi:hypothetical protein